MSTKTEFQWERGGLRSMEARKVENGFVVKASAVVTADMVIPSDYEYACETGADALQVMADCFAWDRGSGDATPSRLPKSFLRFDARDGSAVAVFAGPQLEERSYTDAQLMERIVSLGQEEGCDEVALQQWRLLVTDLRCYKGSIAADSPSKFPTTFVRFDIDGTYVTAVFKEWGVECRHTPDRLDRHIRWLRETVDLYADELEPWHAVLKELSATKEAALTKEGAGA